MDSQLNLKMHTEYARRKLSKCVGILCKAKKCVNQLSSTFTILHTLVLSIVWEKMYTFNFYALTDQ